MFIYLYFRTTYMKTTRLFSFLILISLVSNANAQLRVLSNGRVQAGLLKDNNEDLGNVTSMQIYGRIGDARAGSKLTLVILDNMRIKVGMCLLENMEPRIRINFGCMGNWVFI